MAKELTPLMKQYWEMKKPHPDKILMFRMGDFFEMFYEDAQKAAPLLGILLTARNKKSGDQTPMCGIPHHSVAVQINKLLAHGLKVAICDQVEDAKFAKGLVKRAITRILTPGMVYDPETLEATQNNYICAVGKDSVAFLEATTGEYFSYQSLRPAEVKELIFILQPVELIVASEEQMNELQNKWGQDSSNKFLWTVFAGEKTDERVRSYALELQGDVLAQTLQPLELREYGGRLKMGPHVLNHLEVFRTYKGDTQSTTLFSVMNRCASPGGGRLLKQWMRFPLAKPEPIHHRMDQVEGWVNNYDKLLKVREQLKQLGDFERRLGKLSNPSSHPRDLNSMKQSLQKTLEVLNIVEQKPHLLKPLRSAFERIESTLEDEIPVKLKEGGMIRKGFCAELDELMDLSTNAQKKVLELELREKELTGISTLKVRYNNVFGYYIEVTKTHASKVPLDRYQRKQTLTNAERYCTEDLNDLEQKVMSARTKRLELENHLYQELRSELLKSMSAFLEAALFMNETDVYSGLAWLATENNYCRPTIGAPDLNIKASRHPVVERCVSFVANDILISKGETLLMTGPNMAGKSTLMRQVALTALMAQTGSFVAAKQAELPIYDHLYTRIGASDFLAEGLSTFMVEMQETAEMLNQATENSLLILDEVGRGTSTYDGLSLAQSIVEYLLKGVSPMVLFATHYHELTDLEQSFENLKNQHMSIHERKGKLEFLYVLTSGAAGRSYGIQVAKIAGLPTAVTQRAEGLLARLHSEARPLEAHATWDDPTPKSSEAAGGSAPQLDLWASLPAEDTEEVKKSKQLLEEMSQVAIQQMTPLDALNKIASWQKDFLS